MLVVRTDHDGRVPVMPPETYSRDQLTALRIVQEKVVMRCQVKVIASQADLIAAQSRLAETDEALARCPDPLPIMAFLREASC